MSDLHSWLKSLGLEKHLALFEREEIDLGVLADLTEADLERIGLPLGARKRLLRAVHELAQRELEELTRLAEDKAKLEATLAQKETEYRKREAEDEARRLAEARARAEAEAEREAEMARREAQARAQAAAEEKARREAIEKARVEAAADLARREADYARREAEAKARADAESKARREIEEKAKRDAELRAEAEAEARARRDAQEKAHRVAEAEARAEAEALATKEAEERRQREAQAAKREAELKKKLAETARVKIPVLPIVAALVVIAGSAGGWFWYSAGESSKVAELSAALDASVKATQELNVALERQKEFQSRLAASRLAEAEARARGDQSNLKALQEQTKKAEAEAQKQALLVRQRELEAKKADDAARVAEARKQPETPRAIAEKAAPEKLAPEKTAADKPAADKSAAAKVAPGKAAAEKPGWPAVGDRWVYEIRDPYHPDTALQAVVDVRNVTASSIQDVFTATGRTPVAVTHRPGARLLGVAPGVYVFSPYLRAFQAMVVGDHWPDIVFQNVGECGTLFDCAANARIAGKERVSVRAGAYDAWKIVVEFRVKHMTAPGSARGEIICWYSEDAKQIVRYQTRMTSAMWADPTNMDMELVSYAPAAAR